MAREQGAAGWRESELLMHIYSRSGTLPLGSLVAQGPGDDTAVLRIGQTQALLTVDQLIAGRHYDPASTPVDRIAHKALARSLSDIAAMGGAPSCGVAAAALGPDAPDPEQLFDAMLHAAIEWECPLVGGDISSTPGPTTLSVTLLGSTHPGRGWVSRSGARPGDAVYVTGALGGALDSGRHLTFQPRLAAARALCDALGDDLTAMIDLSDGLGRDAARLADASGVEITFQSEQIPRHPDVEGWRRAASEGEDYELLFSARREPPATIADVPVTRIGVVAAGSGAWIVDEAGTRVDARDLGWDHAAGGEASA